MNFICPFTPYFVKFTNEFTGFIKNFKQKMKYLKKFYVLKFLYYFKTTEINSNEEKKKNYIDCIIQRKSKDDEIAVKFTLHHFTINVSLCFNQLDLITAYNEKLIDVATEKQ